VLAISRIYLDNIDNIQVSWVTQGPKIGQIGLFFGGNDFGSLMIEENVVASCGVTYSISLEELVHHIKEAGFKAVQRDMLYNHLRTLIEKDLLDIFTEISEKWYLPFPLKNCCKIFFP